MKRFIIAVAVVASFYGVSQARLIGANPTGVNSDINCFGGQLAGNVVKAYNEVCLDASGSWLPTSGANSSIQNLGSAALAWDNTFAVATTITGSLTIPSLTSAQIAASTPVSVGIIAYNSTIANVCVSTGTTLMGYKLIGTASTTCQ